jgi:phosphate transport system substrate-binding protein
VPDVLHIPTTMGAAVLAYNVPGVTTGLRLTPETVAGIFLGTITNWNDPAVVADNPTLALQVAYGTIVFWFALLVLRWLNVQPITA